MKRWSAATAEILALVPTIGKYYSQKFIGETLGKYSASVGIISEGKKRGR